MIEKLRPHQIEPAKTLRGLLSRFSSVIDASDTGTGKTYVAASVAHDTGLPCCVVGPKISRATWERAAAHFDDRFSFVNYELVRTGNTPFGKWDRYKPGTEYLKCQICQLVVDAVNPAPCPHHPQGIHSVERKRKAPSYGNFVWHPAIKLLIFDEAHRAGARDSLNAELVIAAKRQGIKTLLLSATPAQSPLQMRALGYALDLHFDKEDEVIQVPGQLLPRRGRPSFYRWAAQYGCRQDARFKGFKWLIGAEEQRRIMLEIRQAIIPSRGIRITYDQIPDFPSRLVLPELYTLDDPAAVDSCYSEMAAARAELREKAANDKDPEGALTKILRERQEVELLKIPAATELAQDDLDKGRSVVIFVNFSQSIAELKKRFPDAGIIDGSPESFKTRDIVVDRFQCNKMRQLLVNAEAGGVCLSLQDLTGECPRSGIVFPSFSATTFRQVLGRLHRHGGKTPCVYKVLFAANTVEEKIHKALKLKLDALDSLLDADLMPENLAL